MEGNKQEVEALSETRRGYGTIVADRRPQWTVRVMVLVFDSRSARCRGPVKEASSRSSSAPIFVPGHEREDAVVADQDPARPTRGSVPAVDDCKMARRILILADLERALFIVHDPSSCCLLVRILDLKPSLAKHIVAFTSKRDVSVTCGLLRATFRPGACTTTFRFMRRPSRLALGNRK